MMKDDVATKASEIKENVALKWEEIKTATAEKWENIKTTLASNWQSMKEDTLLKVREIKEDVTARWEEIRQSTSSKWASVKGSVADSINTIKDKISEGIEKIKEWNATKVKEKVFTIVERIKRVFSGGSSGGGATYTSSNFSGTSFFQGGLTMVGELGPELVELPRGSRIYNDYETKNIMGGNKGITQHITINTPTPLTPAETARQIKNASRQLALEW